MTETRTDPATTDDAALEAHRAAIAEAKRPSDGAEPHYAPAGGTEPQYAPAGTDPTAGTRSRHAPAGTEAPEAEAPHPPADPDALRAEIELTRAQLADTVAALAAKTDVKSRVRGSVSAVTGQVRNRARGAADHARDTIGGVGDRMSAATHSLHRGGHRRGREALPPPDMAAEPVALPDRTVALADRRSPTVLAGAVAGALVGALVYLLWRGRR